MSETFDFIVVGGGSAGAVIAARGFTQKANQKYFARKVQGLPKK
jgi:pyruvate/2-oxoglutarate dehydrogenase complex dihydrolipoamide dehydrogenase (E3) component